MKKQKNILLGTVSGFLMLIGLVLGAIFIVIGINSDNVLHFCLLIPLILLLAGAGLSWFSGHKLKKDIYCSF